MPHNPPNLLHKSPTLMYRNRIQHVVLATFQHLRYISLQRGCTGTGFNKKFQPYFNISGDVQLHKPPVSAAGLTDPCYFATSLMTKGNTALTASSRGKKAYG
ncbi:hypothetical protein GIB67_025560 [Kingdonia uniflora]|uniref:Uncharacterized protein n=1 Tax=Kingdonia uniflora TaxID=39325 RepID=A0A7J7M0D8_9MAGN|nr:hypothetical protein GIB67_025560 [Kingdonia uniflora]